MRRLRKFLALTPAGRGIVLRSALLLPLVAVLLRARGMARAMVVLAHLGRGAGSEPDMLAPKEIARLVNATASILGASCLPRSMVLRHLLHRRGVASEIRLGVSKRPDGRLSAHAWVETDGVPLIDGTDVFARYEALPGFPNRYRADRT